MKYIYSKVQNIAFWNTIWHEVNTSEDQLPQG